MRDTKPGERGYHLERAHRHDASVTFKVLVDSFVSGFRYVDMNGAFVLSYIFARPSVQ